MRISDWRSDVCSSDLIYWMVNMSFKTNSGILSSFSLLPQHFTLDNYITIFTDRSWYSGYINSLIYVALNTVISLSVALPAAYAFSRYRFLGDQPMKKSTKKAAPKRKSVMKEIGRAHV